MNPDHGTYSRQFTRAAYPLADAPTPHYLRRFSYIHNGEVRIFDEALHGPSALTDVQGSSISPSSVLGTVKRASQLMGPEDPAPKRREKEVDEEFIVVGDDELVANASHSAPPATPEQIPLPPLAHTQVPSVHPREAEQPALLSPTASPRSPPSPEASPPDISGLDEEEESPSLTPATAASTRAFAPYNGAQRPQSNDPQTSRALTFNSQPRAAYTVPFGVPYGAPHETPYGLHQDSDEQRSLLHYLSVPPGVAATSQDELPTQLSGISNLFDRLPPSLHRYTIFNLFRHCSRSTLSALYSELESSLRFDIVAHLPPELGSMVLRHLDVKSVAAAAQVSKKWYKLVDRDEHLWLQFVENDALRATQNDFKRARKEGWGYCGWPTAENPAMTPPVNAFGQPVNIYKAVYRRLALMYENWMRPDLAPRQYTIACPDRETITCLEFNEDIIIASTEGKRHLNVYDTQTGKLLHEFTSHEGGVWALKRVGKDTIVSGSTDHTVRIWSLSKNRCTHVFRGHHATVRCLDVVMPIPGVTSRDYPVILTGSRDTSMRMWRLPGPDDEDYDSSSAYGDLENPYFLAELRGHEESVRAVCGHGDVAVSGSYDHKVRVWDLNKKKCRHTLVGHDHKVYATLIDPERNRCISASMDNTIKVWDLNNGSQLYTLAGHTGLVGLLGLRDNTLVSAAADKTLRIWNPEDGRLEHRLAGHDTAILCFDHDGRRIVSGSECHLKLWNARTGEFTRDLLTDVEHIRQVRFDRRRCVAAAACGHNSFLQVLDFDFDPQNPPSQALQPPQTLKSLQSARSRIHDIDDDAMNS